MLMHIHKTEEANSIGLENMKYLIFIWIAMIFEPQPQELLYYILIHH